MMHRFKKYIVIYSCCFSFSQGVFSQDNVKADFVTAVHNFKDQLASQDYALTFYQHTYIYDLNDPMESIWQQIIKKGREYSFHSEGTLMLALSDCSIIVDSVKKIIYIADPIPEQKPLFFMEQDSIFQKLNIERRILKNKVVYKVDMYSLNTEVESVQYHFSKDLSTLERVVVYYKEGEYYEDKDHIAEKQLPVQELVIGKINSFKGVFPRKNDFFIKKDNEYITAPSFKDFVLRDSRVKK